MEKENQILDGDILGRTSGVEEQQILGPNKFAFLSIITFGMYPVWWMYKSWRFFQQKEKSDITPAARAIFGIFYVHSLFTRMLEFAKERGYDKSYSPTQLLIGFILLSIASRLPAPFFLLSLLSFLLYIQPINAFNFALQNSPEIYAVEKSGFSGKQIALIIFGAIFWGLVLVGLSVTEGY